MPGSEIEFLVNMDAVDDIIGTGFALDSIGRQSRYMQDLITSAYGAADQQFNIDVAAFAATTGKLGHMFEWGTVGINNSPSDMQLDPTDRRARLWKMEFHPGRKISRLDYSFQQSVAVVPKPPAEKTGIPQDILDKLKSHIFYDKAMVMELGIPVTISPKSNNERQLLFVPNIWKGASGFTWMRGPTQPNISEKTKGTFTIYFMDYWNGEGAELIQTKVAEYFQEDVDTVFSEIRTGNIFVPAEKFTQDGRIARRVRTVRNYMEKAAMQRAAMVVRDAD